MKSVMAHNFSQIPKVQIPRSVFDRTHGYKTAFDAGYLVPFFVDEALPGDTFDLKASMFGRLATPKTPFMDNLFLETFYFAVPNRLVWENWERFNGAQDNPSDSTDFLIPTVGPELGGFSTGSLFDYMGIPPGISNIDVNSLPMRAYNLIWNTWFRDQNLQDSLIVPLDNGPDDVDWFQIQKRNKKHDYFTSCLPWPQKGDGVEVDVLGGTYAVQGTGVALGLEGHLSGFPDDFGLGMSATASDALEADTTWYNKSLSAGFQSPVSQPNAGVPVGITQTGVSGMAVTIPSTPLFTINALREAFQIQKLWEKDARGGTRYVEILKAHFGVSSPDYRLQRPEYLGGSSTRININPVAQTSSTDATTPQANLAAFGTVADSRKGFTKSFTEHCIIIGLVNVRADLTYQQGLNRMWSRKTRFDFFWPSFAHLGEQAVLNKEIYTQGTSADEDVFGYQERFAEYRYKPSLITGKFRSTVADSLDVWHLSQEFGSLPELNDTFITDNPPIARVIAVPSEPHILFDSYIELRCTRPMPVYSVPGMIDHF